jgi:hypothetical protein
MQIFNEIWTGLQDFFWTIVDLLSVIVSGFTMLITIIPQGIALLIGLVPHLPEALAPFVTATILLSVVLFILGRRVE